MDTTSWTTEADETEYQNLQAARRAACKHPRKFTLGRERICAECGEGWEILDDWDLS